MPPPGITRFEPTIMAMGVMVDIWLVGIPALSSSFVINAPQRVLVPQVEVKTTASIPSSLIALAMPSPIVLALTKEVATPAVA